MHCKVPMALKGLLIPNEVENECAEKLCKFLLWAPKYVICSALEKAFKTSGTFSLWTLQQLNKIYKFSDNENVVALPEKRN